MHLIDGPLPPVVISEVVANAGKNTESGGLSIFVGQVRRDLVEGRFVKAIEYSAYEEMVIGEADKINKSILSEFDDVKKIEILHSRGLVNAGEISLLVAVSAGHRHQAINACSKAVELIKAKLPIWKKEIFEDNSTQWKGNE
ncbi:MAG: molybdenum cofactor biosynthesis protein MoaE [Bacteroidales bacterium]